MATKEAILEQLKRAAAAGYPITYGKLTEELGGIPNGWGPKLTEITATLNRKGLPLLPVLVVRADTGLPSPDAEIYRRFGLTTTEDLRREQRRCFGFDWSGVADLW